MCYYCYKEAGCPVEINEKVKEAVKLIEALYELPEGGAGGYGHIVFDDWDIETNHIDWCIEEANKKEDRSFSDEECRIASIVALEKFKELSLPERYTALALESGFINKD